MFSPRTQRKIRGFCYPFERDGVDVQRLSFQKRRLRRKRREVCNRVINHNSCKRDKELFAKQLRQREHWRVRGTCHCEPHATKSLPEGMRGISQLRYDQGHGSAKMASLPTTDDEHLSSLIKTYSLAPPSREAIFSRKRGTWTKNVCVVGV